MARSLILLPLLILAVTGYSQTVNNPASVSGLADSSKSINDSLAHLSDRDITDYIHFRSRREKPLQRTTPKKNIQISLIPAAGYTLQTGFSALLAANTVFYTDKTDKSHSSTILASIIYTEYNQVILPLAANIWTKNNRYNIISDVRYMSYPSPTYGLGPDTDVSDGYQIDFSYFKFHQTVLRRINGDFFAGAGYYYDYFWNMREVNPPAGTTTSFQEYGLHRRETASGISFQGIYDTRANQVNPSRGSYVSGRYRVNPRFLGSTTDWQSGVIELRKFIPFPSTSKSVLALWNYNWVTFHGRPPYVLLPSTGWDDFFNTGRGYIQGRYRAKNMSYLEAEYRFNLTKSGLFGAVVFTNLQTFSNVITKVYGKLVPGAGAGLRIKVNKHSSTNLAIDYAFGAEGSRGFFINLGEVF